MELAKVRNRIRGWLPHEPSSLRSVEQSNAKSDIAAYAAGYGVGLCIYEVFIVSVNMAGWGAFESSLSEPFDILSSILICFIGTMLALAIGAILSRKLKERWIR
jgi:hypothetical protein